MGFDSLKGKVEEHTKRRDATRQEFTEFQKEDERVWEAGKAMERLDEEIQLANYALQARYYEIGRDFERQFEELEAEGDRLAEEVSDELSIHGKATEKLGSVERLKYGEQAASARRVGEALMREL